MIPDSLATQPIFLCVDDTMVAKAGTRFENVSKLFDHAAHNGSNYLNGHCFVSIMLCTPVWKNDRVSYLSLPLGYRMWQKKESKLELAASMIRQVMPEFQEKKQVIILCDSWYTKRNLVSIVDEYLNLDLIGNARIDSVMYASAHTGRRGRPAKHGKRLSVETDFAFSNEKIGDYYIGAHRVITNLFGCREIQAYVTATEKEHGTKRLFFSTIFPEDLQIFCAWQEKEPLNQTGSDRMKYIPLFLYSFRWNIIPISALGILKQATMNRKRSGLFATFVKNIETHIKSNAITKALKQLIHQQVYVDMKNREIHVGGQLVYYEGGEGYCFHNSETKTDADIRDIPMTQMVYDAFRKQRELNLMLGLQSNVEIGGRSGFIFNTKHGRPIMPAGVNSFLKNIVNAYNKKESKLAEEENREPELMPPISSHTLRHTGCTRLGENNVNPKVMQYVMGHSDAQITMNVYNHIAEKSHVENEMSKMNLPETVPAVV